MTNYKQRLTNVLKKYNYSIREVTYLDKIKNVYVANKLTNRVEKCITDTTWQGISEQVSYNLAMFGTI